MLSRGLSNGTGSDAIAKNCSPKSRDWFELLTSREREIMTLVTAGLMNKQVAAEVGLSEITVKIHRGHLMRKMGVRSLADLVRAARLSDCVQRRRPRHKHLYDFAVPCRYVA